MTFLLCTYAGLFAASCGGTHEAAPVRYSPSLSPMRYTDTLRRRLRLASVAAHSELGSD